MSFSGNLRLSLFPFVYNSLYRVRNVTELGSAVDILSGFDYLVCAEPGHLAPKEILVADSIKANVKLFGYVNMGGSPLADLKNLKAEVDGIKKSGWFGVFIDQFGYDFGETRERQNALVTYAHSVGLKCFVNCWMIDDAFGNGADAVHNPAGLQSALGEGDWYLLESFLTRNDGVDIHPDAFWEKIRKAQEYKDKFKINVTCLSYKKDGISWEEVHPDIENSYLLSLLSGFDGWWFTDKLENDSFLYGMPGPETGNVLIEPLHQVAPGIFLAETDKYLVLYDATEFPVLRHELFDLTSKTDLMNYLLHQ